MASINLPMKLWCAYIGAVIGINHQIEWKCVLDWGTKLSHNLAKALFPKIDETNRWRD